MNSSRVFSCLNEKSDFRITNSRIKAQVSLRQIIFYYLVPLFFYLFAALVINPAPHVNKLCNGAVFQNKILLIVRCSLSLTADIERYEVGF